MNRRRIPKWLSLLALAAASIPGSGCRHPVPVDYRNAAQQEREERWRAAKVAEFRRNTSCPNGLTMWKQADSEQERKRLYFMMSDSCKEHLCETLVFEWREEKDLAKKTLLYEELPADCQPSAPKRS